MLALLVAELVAGSVPVPLNKPIWAESRPGLDGVRIEMVVDATGEALGCAPVGPGSSTGSVEKVCAQAMARARFKPARDDSGTKIAGVYRFTVGAAAAGSTDLTLSVSRLPPGSGVPITGLRFVTGTAGAVESCAVDQTSGSPQLDGAACSYVARTRFAPVLDETGTPVRVMRAVSVGFAAASAR